MNITLQKECSPVGPGKLVIVVGPSGAGKDTLLDGLKANLSHELNVMFARRLITRKADMTSEDHASLTIDEMNALIANNGVALSWPAHGLTYALPLAVDQHIRQGGTVIANGSRAILLQAQEKYQTVVVVHVTAPLEVLAKRLSQRGRESHEQILDRLKRANLSLPDCKNLITINNCSTPTESIRQLYTQLINYIG
ncbi:phosphonate metabolism protein/1,5-bisphosphokinase (PRPP-forming) PhnN [Polycladidibacter stylochi]|uniref:phosphonate metabolism protein/1,5-bisphosphokinase (PRPP-forming) PhnN n=1 Tax=Polycladidibacter stylochi TaxID=1807766 RepID=UPI000830F783|nr:phosphonate metabolism protein/1,5-bisphosphokinase (PRPP-forming) PhnN [Pseudovibrio stylochi]